MNNWKIPPVARLNVITLRLRGSGSGLDPA